MNHRAVLASLLLAGLLLLLAAPAFAQQRSDVVTEISMTGSVDPFMAGYVKRSIEHAPAAILIRIETPGGLG
ncbi:MAG: hypothetical protein ABR552_06000 [Actinomycetota bacterium]